MAAPPDTPRSLAALRDRYGERHRWWVLVTVMIGNMAALMAATTVNVAVPAISLAFALGQQQAQWLATAFMGPMTLAMLVTPWLLERYGYRLATFGMLGLLALGGVVGGLASDIGLVLAARAVEGLAAGVLQTIPGIIILRAFAPHEQGRAMGLFGFGTVLAPAIGPSVGGVLVEWFGWRAIFFFVLPFCLLGAELGRRFLPHSAPGGVAVNSDAPLPDGISLLLLAALLGTLLVGMGRLQGVDAALGWSLLGTTALLVLGFLARQRRAAAPLLRLDLFRRPVFAAGALVSGVYGATLFGSTYLLPVFMVVALGLPPSTVGAVLMPAGLALAIAIPVAGRCVDRWPLHRSVAGGLLAMALSFGAMVGIGPAVPIGWTVALAVLGRIGLGFVIPSLSIGALRGSEPALIAAGSSAIGFVRQLGGVLGVGLVGIGLEWRLRSHGAGGSLRAFHEVFVVMAALTLLAALTSRWMRAPSPGD